MQHILFGSDTDKLEVALLIKDTGFNKTKLADNYLKPLTIPKEQFVAFNLKYDTPKKCKAELAKEYLADLLPPTDDLGI